MNILSVSLTYSPCLKVERSVCVGMCVYLCEHVYVYVCGVCVVMCVYLCEHVYVCVCMCVVCVCDVCGYVCISM